MVLRSRMWWQEVTPRDWFVFGMPEDLTRERYLALLAALEGLSTRGPMSTLSDITAGLKTVGYHDPLSDAELRSCLDQLHVWGFADPFHDYAAPLRNLQGLSAREEAWALTHRGRGVVAAVRTAVVDVVRALQLPSRLLDGVEGTIRAILDHLRSEPGRLPSDLEDVRTRIDELQRVSADFYAALAKMVQADVTDNQVFGENRDRVVEALRQFPREYSRGLPRVEAALGELREAGFSRTVEAAAEHAGLVDAADQQHWIDERIRRLGDLEAWFKPDGTVYRLIDSASGAVHTLLVAIDRRYMARRRGSDLGVDFRALAHSLHRQPNDTETRRVYAAAFGDWPAWHPVIGASEEDVAHGTPARAGAARHHVEVTLREHERHGPSTGRPRKVPDTAADRAAALARAQADALRRRRLLTLLVTDGEVGLQHFAGLPWEAATVLMQAVEVALSQYDPAGGVGRASVDDADLEVTVRPGQPRTTVTIELAEGRLTGPDLRVSVTPSGAAPATGSAAAEPDESWSVA
ncbi:DUF2397 family protein [Streptomyces sp. ID38640]|uniref:DUF2397 family protein n=1 Tax=Streptomyces sp. ID38640 TaxID=1265399 RepID=UPI00140F218A|nr:DUF2397 family protein [Streptomyces sp. ID38640]QIK04716.1 DUF2397 family protein [Streptomyces sp. ID38640]QIK10881.1 DUF2397 family protein [Streptomyces sp. ID38640]QIK10930.1 DUF2397 family protein [Streptomyces sp. ID38640]